MPSHFSTLRRALCATALLAGLSPSAFAASNAANFPSRPLTLIVPFAAGGGTDSIARDLARQLGDTLGQPVVVENRGGGGGAIGANAVAHAAPDGHTLLFATSTFVTNAAAQISNTYDVEKSFAPVAMMGRGPLLLVTSKDLNVGTVDELRAYAKEHQNEVNYCSAGAGSINHLSGELFNQKAGLSMTHVPYKGSGPATVDLLAGRVQVFFATVPTMLTQIQDDRVKLLAVTGKARSTLFPDVPTVIEAGVPGYDITTWWGILAPAGTSDDVVAKLNQAVNNAAASDLVRNRLQHEGAEQIKGTPADFAAALSKELALWQGVVKQSGMTLQ